MRFLWWLVLGPTLLAAEPKVISATVVEEARGAQTWTVLTGEAEASSTLAPDQLAAVISDWAAYPQLFPKIKAVQTASDGDETLLTETTEVSVLGFSIRNRFTVRVRRDVDPQGVITIHWVPESNDGKIDHTFGTWTLKPVPGGTQVHYWTKTSTLSLVPGQAGILSMFFPNELKQIVNAVLNEAQKRKEKR